MINSRIKRLERWTEQSLGQIKPRRPQMEHIGDVFSMTHKEDIVALTLDTYVAMIKIIGKQRLRRVVPAFTIPLAPALRIGPVPPNSDAIFEELGDEPPSVGLVLRSAPWQIDKIEGYVAPAEGVPRLARLEGTYCSYRVQRDAGYPEDPFDRYFIGYWVGN